MNAGSIDIESFSTTDAMVAELAKRWITRMSDRPDRPFRVALSGGRVAARFQQQAGLLAIQQPFDWSGIEFFWGDERCVPPDHNDSNFRAANEALLLPCGVPKGQIHRLQGELSPLEGARLATEELSRYCPINEDGWPVLDLVFLGMGEDGHVASLFPNTPASQADSREWVIPVIGPKPPPQRLSLTYGVLAAAKEVWVLASGADKGPALAASLAENGTTPLAQLLKRRLKTLLATEKLLFSAS